MPVSFAVRLRRGVWPGYRNLKRKMDNEQFKEWGWFQERATEIVRRGNTPTVRGGQCLFQIMMLPSFEPVVGWQVFQKVSQSKEKDCFAIRTCWKRNEDAQKFTSPIERLKHPRELNPTIQTEIFNLSEGTIESFIKQFRSVKVPAFVEVSNIGTDGTSYEFSFDHLFLSAHYTWWEEPPAEWKELYDAVIQAIHYFENLSLIVE